MAERGPRLPTSLELSRLGVHIDQELHAGKQSRVFAVAFDGQHAVLKLTERRLSDSTVLAERMLMAEALAAHTDAVVAPMRIAGRLVHPVGAWLATATSFVDGARADLTDTADARLMGRTLAGLHDVLARLRPFALPPIAALDVVDDQTDRSDWQLLHGDFSDQNVIVTSAGSRVVDFDDCGYGPVTYDIANSLYMVLFDAEVSGRHERYEAFRPSFLEGYVGASGTDVGDSAVDSMIARRIDALGRWLDDLARAPIGIRTSSPEWRDRLRAFVTSQTASGPGAAR